MNEMNSNNYEEEQWFPQLPEGYEAQQTDHASWSSWESQPMALNGWNQHQQPSWNQPPQQGWNQWNNPSHSQPGWPGFPGSSHQQGWPGQPNWPWQGGMNPQPPPYPGSGGGGGGNQQAAPTSAPPSQAPPYPDQQGAQMLRVDPGGIRGCMFRMTYIWTSRRNGFWFFPTFVGRTSIAGYRWNDQWRRWTYTGLDLDRVEAFTCI